MNEDEGLEVIRRRIRNKRDEEGKGHRTRGRKPSPLIKKICGECGGEFKVRDIKAERKRKYCNPQCGNKAKSKSSPSEYVYDLVNGKRTRVKKSELSAGTKKKDRSGYVHIFDGDRWSLEHRSIMEKYLGRKLVKGEIIHHKNGIKDDNRLENLELMVNMNHSHGVDHIHKEDFHRLILRVKGLYDQLEENGIPVKPEHERIHETLRFVDFSLEKKQRGDVSHGKIRDL